MCLASVGAVAVESGFVSVQQVWHFLAVMYVRGRDAGTMYQAALAVRANMQLHAEVPLIALLGLMHFRVACLVLTFGRRRHAAIKVASIIVPSEGFMLLASNSSPTFSSKAERQGYPASEDGDS